MLSIFVGNGFCADTQRQPNVVFILADDLGYGDLGCYGQRRIQTHHLDRMAKEGMRFTQFYAGSTVCAPSRCTLMTGLHTGYCLIRGNALQNLRPTDVTVARLLKGAGYRTGLIGKWGLGTEGDTGVPTKQGFDSFFGYLDQVYAHNYYPHFLIRDEKRVRLKNEVPASGEKPFGSGVATKKIEYSHDLFAREALDFIEKNRDRPFFLYLAFTIPHANNEAGKKGMEVPDLGTYKDNDWPEPQKGHAAMITRMDADIGRLFAKLKRLGLDENTIVFFSSDNGPHKEGGADPAFNRSSGPLRGFKRDLTEGGIRVPFLVRWPGKVTAGTTSDFVGAFWDVLPTLAELAGASDKVPPGLDGLSFVPTLLGQKEKQKQHESLYWAFFERGAGRALRMGKWKAMQQPLNTPIRLYDLDKDIGETKDLASEEPDVVAKMKKRMDGSFTPSERWRFPTPGK
ncbi:MAG TPA: arylsulfatase [Gemmataceae bacterium]|nr:arylsulfatase [Gemmataceae bacterium]